MTELAEPIVEKILASLPFPHILKVRLLSRAWRSRFFRLASPRLSLWPQYCCVLGRDGLVAYDLQEDREKKLSLVNTELDFNMESVGYAACGPLLVILRFLDEERHKGLPDGGIVVFNVLTGRRRGICFPFSNGDPVWLYPVVGADGNRDYKLLLAFHPLDSSYPIQHIYMYDSQSRGWTQTLIDTAEALNTSCSAVYSGGALHYINSNTFDAVVTRFDLLTGSSIRMPLENVDLEGESAHLVLCGANILALVLKRQWPFCLKVFQMDTDSCSFQEISRLGMIHEPFLMELVHCDIRVRGSRTRLTLYVAELQTSHRAIVYDLESYKWSRLDSLPDSFHEPYNVKNPLIMDLTLMDPFVEP